MSKQECIISDYYLFVFVSTIFMYFESLYVYMSLNYVVQHNDQPVSFYCAL